MRLLISLLGAAMLGGAAAQAEPLVVGFDRFHASAPDAAGGRLLFNELGCANCHGGDPGLPKRRGPVLHGVTQRANVEWLRKFLAAPSAAHPGTAMPQLLAAEEVEPVLHFLASLKPRPTARPKSLKYVNPARGVELFHTLGCVACHAPDPAFQPAEGAPAAGDFSHRSVQLPAAVEKYSLASLAAFLRDPLATRPDGRMPRTPLEEDDLVDLAAALLKIAGSDGSAGPALPSFVADPALATRGREVVTAKNCAACHDLPELGPARTVPIVSTSGGCIKGAPESPRYELSAAQRAAVSAYLQSGREPLPAALATTLTLEALNCLACHERDGLGGPDPGRKAYFQGDHNLGDTGRYPPPLTGVGRKLQPEWLVKVLAGENRVRPYLQARMPIYGASVAELPAQLARVDARPAGPLPGGDDSAGRKLLGTLGGLGCITCHQWGDRAALGIQALDLSNLGQRLQPGWVREYLVHPAGYRPGTLMPSFWPEGVAANREILGGDTDRQIASIYSFAKSANGEPEGFPELSGGKFELVPKDRPIVQRTFFEKVGTHAILVGFPSGTHLAYEGEHGRPAMVWRGRFFDAYQTWFSRFAPFAKPLGSDAVEWPAPTGGTSEVRGEGYRLDAQGVPIFLLRVGAAAVEERFEGVTGGLRRVFTGEAAVLRALPIAHPPAMNVTEAPATAARQRAFLYTWK